MRITALSGGVGGARMARGIAALDDIDLTVVVNVGDDDSIYGLNLAPDIDTVAYTLAHLENPDQGWGRTGETWNTMAELDAFPIDTKFRLGDKDLALNLFRSARLGEGATLSEVTAQIAKLFGIRATLLPATDDPVRTKVRIRAQGRWIDFQDYFVRRRHAVPIDAVRFDGADRAGAAPGVIEAIDECDAVVIGPSNPFLSIWPILAIPGITQAMARKERVMLVSPLIGGEAVKGPLADIMPMLGYEPTTVGIVHAYDGLVTDIVIHDTDALPTVDGLRVHSADTRIADALPARLLARAMVSWLE
jgi:LPPG:FO 2-phospho-L-lactate transferase